MQKSVVMVHFYSLSLEGLKLRYRSPLGTTTLHFDAKSTCILLQELDIIEGVDIDGNEPVILYTEERYTNYGGCEWSDFVRIFRLSKSEVQKIAERHYGESAPAVPPDKEATKSDRLIIREVLPPPHLYHLHRIYETKIKGK